MTSKLILWGYDVYEFLGVTLEQWEVILAVIGIIIGVIIALWLYLRPDLVKEANHRILSIRSEDPFLYTYQAVEVVERNWLVRRLLGLFSTNKLKNGKKFLITSASSSSAVASEEWYRISKDKRKILINYKRLERLPSYQFKLRKERNLDLATLIKVIPKKIIKDGVEMETRFVERPEDGQIIREIEFEVEKDCNITQCGFVTTFLSRPKGLQITREFTEEGLKRTEIIAEDCIEILPVFSYDEWKGAKKDIVATQYELRWFSDLNPARNTFRITYK